MRKSSPGDFLRINIVLLRRFGTPTSAFDLFRAGAGNNYSGVFSQVNKLLKLGLITWAFTGSSCKGGVKKFWVLTKKGRLLLELFPEKETDDSLLEAAQ